MSTFPGVEEAKGPAKKEFPIPVKGPWGGMMSALPLDSIPPQGFSYLLNMYFISPFKVRTRPGTVEYMGDDTTGSVEILEGKAFRKTGEVQKYFFVCSNRNIYSFEPTDPNTLTLIGQTTNLTPVDVTMAVLNDKLYICDGQDALEWDGTTLSSIADNFPTFHGDFLYVKQGTNRLWWGDDEDFAYGSAIGDGSEYLDKSLGAVYYEVGKKDGLQITSFATWGRTVIISKGDDDSYWRTMYWLSGTNHLNYEMLPLFGDQETPFNFVGKSALQIGDRLIGLTPEGFADLAGINTTKDVTTNRLSGDIDDIVQRINFGASNKICAVYDTNLKLYLCAVPLDGASSNNHVIAYDMVHERWSVWDNWTVRSWHRIGNKIVYGSEDGRLIQTGIGDNDLGNGFTKIAETGNLDLGYPDIVKYFKSLQVDIEHEGDYTVDLQAIIDGVERNARAISLRLSDTSSLWGVFKWGIDSWGASGDTRKSVYVLGRGKQIRLRFRNDNADEPFALTSITYRIGAVKDSGASETE